MSDVTTSMSFSPSTSRRRPLVTVVIKKRCCFGCILIQTCSDLFFCIIRTLIQFSAVFVAYAFNFRRVKDYMISRSTRFYRCVCPSSEQAAVCGQPLNLQHGRCCGPAPSACHQALRLAASVRGKPSSKNPFCNRLCKTFFHNTVRNLIRNEQSLIDILLRFDPECEFLVS